MKWIGELYAIDERAEDDLVKKAELRAKERREGSRSRVGSANDRPCESTRYLLYEIALALEPPTVVASFKCFCLACTTHRRWTFWVS